jgi:hypothetical protein
MAILSVESDELRFLFVFLIHLPQERLPAVQPGIFWNIRLLKDRVLEQAGHHLANGIDL